MTNENSILQLSMNDFLERSASSSPTPGGGSIAAVQGCLGASMISMVANLTLDNKKYQQFRASAEAHQRRALECLSEFKRLTEADIAVFEKYMQVLRLPKETEEQKAERSAKLQQMAYEAASIPLQIAETACSLLKTACELAEYGNKSAISDVGVAAYALSASVDSALLSVQINLKTIRDESIIKSLQQKTDELHKTAELFKQKTVAAVEQRIG